MLAIPKKLGHIWIGPYDPPLEWINTWHEHHADWEYILYDNKFLKEFPFKTRKLIDEYLDRYEYAGVADLMRYEILYEFGGLIPEADSICYHNTDELWVKPCSYTIYENEFTRGKLVSPIYAAPPKDKFIGHLVNELCDLKVSDLGAPWLSTGNLFVAKMIEKYQPDIEIFPSHYFIPVHYTGVIYSGSDKVYAKQMFGSTRKLYKTKQLNISKRLALIKFKICKNLFKKHRKRLQKKRSDMFALDCSGNNNKIN